MAGAALLVACGDCPPVQDAEIQALDRGQEKVLAERIDAFAGSTSRRICVPRVTVSTVAREQGHYNAASKAVWIDPEADDLELVLQHELCHAADLQNHLSEGLEELLGQTAPRARREAWAEICEVGPELAWLVDEGPRCPEDSGERDALGVVRERLYDRRPVGIGPPMDVWAVDWTLALPDAPAEHAIERCEWDPSDDAVKLLVEGLGDSLFVRADATTGERLAGDASLFDPGPSPVVPGGWWTRTMAETDELTAVTAVHDSEELRVRRMLIRTDRWHVATHCPPVDQCVYARGDQIWVVQADGDGVAAGRIW